MNPCDIEYSHRCRRVIECDFDIRTFWEAEERRKE